MKVRASKRDTICCLEIALSLRLSTDLALSEDAMGEEATPSSSSTDWKAEGNVEFRKKNYLKAAALYTKGIKADPTNAVLYR